jgi:rubrerythrin
MANTKRERNRMDRRKKYACTACPLHFKTQGKPKKCPACGAPIKEVSE